jgi:hypothetical protein
MKKIIAFMLIATMAMVVMGQGTHCTTKTMTIFSSGQNYFKYTAVTTDTLTTNRDTIRIPVNFNFDNPVSAQARVQFNKRAGNDTTAIINIYGKAWSTDTWTKLTTGTTTEINGLTTINLQWMPEKAHVIIMDTLKECTTKAGDNLLYYGKETETSYQGLYNYFMIECIVSGNDYVGTGIKLVQAELKVWRRSY